MKRKLFILALLVMLVVSLAASANAASESYLTFNLNSDRNSYAVTGCYGNAIGNLVIPAIYNGKPVTSIRDYAFQYCSSLTSVTIPDSVTSIGDYAFEDCSSLAGIWVDGNNPSYSSDAYGVLFNKGKTELIQCPKGYSGTYTIPDSVTSVGYEAFYNCSSLTSVTIPDSVTSISYSAFEDCSSLTSVNITDIAAWCGISFLGNTYSESYSNPLYYAKKLYLNGKLVTDLVIPKGVTSIGDKAFWNCTSLTSVTIPNSVTSIGTAAFSGCSSLECITLPFVGDSRKCASDTYQFPFGYIFGTSSYTGGVSTQQKYYGSSTSSTTSTTYYIPSNLKSVTVTSGELLCGAFSGCSSLTSVNIPNSVTSIGDYAFYSCSSLTSVNIPDSVTSIGDYAFEDCSSLTGVYITDVTDWCGISFSDLYANPLYYADNLYLNGELITDLVIPVGVTSVGSSAFEGCSLTSVTIPDSVTSIGDHAFQGCSLTSVTIPNSVTSIGQWAFGWCHSLTNVTIPDSITSISYCAFYGCSDLTSVTIPDSVTSIVSCAFSRCERLTSVTIPDSVTSIGGCAFEGCSSLISVTIPDSVTSIGWHAFYKCNSLYHVFYGGTQNQWRNISVDEYAYLTDAIRHYNMEGYTEIGCTVKGVYCSLCDKTFSAGDEHSFENGVCSVCGAEEPILRFDLKGSSMTLGNTLEINFAVELANLTGENNYIEITKEYADGTVKTATYPQSEWTAQGSKIKYVSFSVTAKEMNDKLTVIVYDAEGEQISETYEDSVAGYCLRKLQQEEERTSPRAKYLTLYVDMLNYGAAAQTMWDYNTAALANAGLTEAQRSYATVITSKANILKKGVGYYGTSLSLKDNILMNIAFDATKITSVKYAVVTFVNHNGADESVIIPIEDFIVQSSKVKYISLDCVAVADYKQPVTIKLYNTAGKVISTSVDSMGSYAGRQTKNVYLYEAILAFGMGAYNYFHS